MKTKRIDITGEKYHRLTAIKEVEPKGKNRRYLCKCDCGNEKIVFMSALRFGNTKSCGCLQKETVSKSRLNVLVGRSFGRLLVLERVNNKPGSNKVRWKCACDCGGIIVVESYRLLSNQVSSCGCIKRELEVNQVTDYYF